MKRSLALRPAVLSAVCITAAATVLPRPLHHPVSLPADSSRAVFPGLAVALEEEAEGGSVLICVLTGMLFGASVISGNAIAAGGAVIGAINNGCLW